MSAIASSSVPPSAASGRPGMNTDHPPASATTFARDGTGGRSTAVAGPALVGYLATSGRLVNFDVVQLEVVLPLRSVCRSLPGTLDRSAVV